MNNMTKDKRKILVIDNGNILMSSAQAVSWVAGFFEGEGNFGSNKKTGKYICPVIQIAQSDRRPLDFVEQVMGLGKVNGPYGPYKTQTKPYYMFMAYGKQALQFVEIVRPFLLYKGEQVDKKLKEINDVKQQ